MFHTISCRNKIKFFFISIVNPRQPNQKQQVQMNFEENSQPERSKTVTFQLYEKLSQVFPEPNQGQHIRKVLDNHKSETDLNRLTNYCMNSLFSQ